MVTIHDRADALVLRLNAKYPEAMLSFGYIGNLSAQHDDRGWFFFTKLATPDRSNYRYALGSTAVLESTVAKAESNLEDWLLWALKRPGTRIARVGDYIRSYDFPQSPDCYVEGTVQRLDRGCYCVLVEKQVWDGKEDTVLIGQEVFPPVHARRVPEPAYSIEVLRPVS